MEKTMPMTRREPYVRLANSTELEELSTLAWTAFLHDPLYNYFGSCTETITETSVDARKRHTFINFLTKSSLLIGGRITVVAVPGELKTEKETIAAVTIWLPPKQRLALWRVLTLLRAGVISVLMGWGLEAVNRVAFEYAELSHAALERAYKTKGIAGSPDDSWYLEMACTHPRYEGRGYMSMLIREAYRHAPHSIFTLESSTPKSRDRYLHLGFELLENLVIGENKVTPSGIAATEIDDATGVFFYVMANWDVSRLLETTPEA